MAWLNADGLNVRFGTELAEVGGGGEYRWTGPFVQHEFDIHFDRLEAFGTLTVLDYVVRIQNGVLLTSAEFEVVEPFAGAGATLSFGLVDATNPVSGSYDDDGIDATIAVTAIDAVGDTITCDGALINTVLVNTGNVKSLLSATVGTANFTAGRGKLRFNYFVPTPYVDPV